MAKDDNLRIKVLIDSRLAEGKLGKLSKLTDKLRKDTNSATNNFIRLNQVLQTSVTTMNTLVSSFNRMGTSLIRATRELRSLDRTLGSVQGRNVNVNVNAYRRNTFGNFARSRMGSSVIDNVTGGGGGGFDATDAALLARHRLNTLGSEKLFKVETREEARKLARLEKIQATYGSTLSRKEKVKHFNRLVLEKRALIRKRMMRVKEATITHKPRKFTNAVGRLSNVVFSGGGLIAGGIGAGVYGILRKAGEREQQGVKLQSLVGDTFGLHLQGQIERFAARTPLQSKDIAKQVQTLSAFGVKNSELLPAAKRIADLALGDRQASETLTRVYGRTKARGTLQGEERAMAIETGRIDPLALIAQLDKSDFIGEAIPKAFQDAQGNFMKRTVADLTEMQRKGMITFDMLRKAFIKATEAGGKYHDALLKQSVTLEGRASTALDILNQRLADIGGFFSSGTKRGFEAFRWFSNLFPWFDEQKGFLNSDKGIMLTEKLRENAALPEGKKLSDEEVIKWWRNQGQSELSWWNPFSKITFFDTMTRQSLTDAEEARLTPEQKKTYETLIANKDIKGARGLEAFVRKLQKTLSPNMTEADRYLQERDDYARRIIKEGKSSEPAKTPEAATIEETIADTNAGGRRSKYIQIDIGTVQAAETMNVSSQELGDETAFLTKTALYKALGHVPEIVTT